MKLIFVNTFKKSRNESSCWIYWMLWQKKITHGEPLHHFSLIGMDIQSIWCTVFLNLLHIVNFAHVYSSSANGNLLSSVSAPARNWTQIIWWPLARGVRVLLYCVTVRLSCSRASHSQVSDKSVHRLAIPSTRVNKSKMWHYALTTNCATIATQRTTIRWRLSDVRQHRGSHDTVPALVR